MRKGQGAGDALGEILDQFRSRRVLTLSTALMFLFLTILALGISLGISDEVFYDLVFLVIKGVLLVYLLAAVSVLYRVVEYATKRV